MRGKPIKCVSFIPDGNGGYRPYDDLSEKEKDEFAEIMTNRMGKVFNDYFSQHPEVYKNF